MLAKGSLVAHQPFRSALATSELEGLVSDLMGVKAGRVQAHHSAPDMLCLPGMLQGQQPGLLMSA